MPEPIYSQVKPEELRLKLKPLDLALPVDAPLTISRSQLTQLLLESHKKSSTATEEVLCLKEIGKINGLYDKKETKVIINIDTQAQQLEEMSDEQLLQLTGNNGNLFDMEPILIEYEDVSDVDDVEYLEVIPDGE